MQGKLIVIEGNDSSGKRTQADLLIKQLSEKGYEVEQADFPQYYTGFFGKLIARYLRGEFGRINQISPYLSSLLYAQDRAEAKPNIERWLKQGKIIVSNRYVPSNKAYGSAKFSSEEKKNLFLDWIDELEYKINKIPKPDLVIYLHVPLEITQKWIKTKESREYLDGKKKDIHEKDRTYLKKVESAYLELVKTNNWIRIDCFENDEILDKEKIAEKVWEKVKFILYNKN
ncbi:dTMP kinase [Candidatus Woesearchaeota archaeon]|nr:dTMP kinase [Candidatus Woesearchaeota archaeon]